MRFYPGTSITAMRIIVFCVLSIFGGRSVAMDETVSALAGESPSTSYPSSIPLSLQAPRYSSLVNSNDPILGGKRAYVYRSEYKRLPLYQFGLGKRWTYGVDDKKPSFSFGLGKRTRHYSFGLGKRNNYDDGDEASLYNLDYIPREHYNAYLQKDPVENFLEAKRAGGFNFGLGKRVSMLNDEEKLPVKHLRDKYLFGLGKRVYLHDSEEEDEEES